MTENAVGPHVWVPKQYSEKELARMTPQQLMDIAKKNIEAIIRRVHQDPKFFVRNFVITQDPHDPANPFKKMPDAQYIDIIIDVWMREKLLLIPKSRQMMISWLMIALHYWLTGYHPGTLTFFKSKKEEDADLLLERANFIHMRLPDWLRPELAYPGKKTYCNMRFKDIDSRIQAVAQTSDAIRSQTATAVFDDEVAFQPYARDGYKALKPTLDGGGRYTGVSTPNGKEFFFNRVFDLE